MQLIPILTCIFLEATMTSTHFHSSAAPMDEFCAIMNVMRRTTDSAAAYLKYPSGGGPGVSAYFRDCVQ
jgi:hypothetical protein